MFPSGSGQCALRVKSVCSGVRAGVGGQLYHDFVHERLDGTVVGDADWSKSAGVLSQLFYSIAG